MKYLSNEKKPLLNVEYKSVHNEEITIQVEKRGKVGG